MKLYLAQHGEALSREEDEDRPLSRRGREEVKRVAHFLLEGRVRVGRVLHSGKTRARQTSELLAEAVCPETSVQQTDGIGPKDPVKPFIRRVENWQDDVLVVGHLPFMERLAGRLVAGRANGAVHFGFGTVLCLELEGEDWRVLWMVRPELLPGK